MTASQPSKTAVATSDTSARVGTGAAIIDSSIWVATTTGLPARRAARVICFWMPGTRSSGISTPRSPRATISASLCSTIAARRSTACGFSILARMPARPRANLRTSARSSARWTKDSAIQSTPVLSAASRSERSFGVSAPKEMVVSGMLTPLRSERWSPTSTMVTTAILGRLGDAQAHAAIVEQQPVADFERREDFRMGQLDARRIAGLGRAVEDEALAERQVDGRLGEGADAQLGSLQVDEDADRVAFLGLDRADGRHQLAHEVVAGVAHVDAEHVRARAEQLRDHRLVGRGGSEGGEDLGPPRPPHVSRPLPADRAR